MTPGRNWSTEFRRIARGLTALSRVILPEFAHDNINRDRAVPFDATQFFRTQTLAVLSITKRAGWNARRTSGGVITGYYWFRRWLRFERLKIQLRNSLIDCLNDALRLASEQLGFSARITVSGLPELNDVTAAVPEIVAAARAVTARSLILDGEAIALRHDGKPHPFQVTMRRFGRKLDVEEVRGELPLSVFFFDCLLRDGEPLVDKGGIDRRKALEAAVPRKNLTPCIVTADKAQAAAFYADALSRGHEGVMAKALDAPYEAGRRGAGWLKVKRAHTLDLVVLAAEWGHGRRRGWLSNLHLGARDPASGGFVMLGKTFKGLTDELLEWQTREILARETGRDDWTVRVRPELVVEIAFNDLQESPHYPGGLALRFARVKGYRPDKSPADADTIETVRRIYEESLS